MSRSTSSDRTRRSGRSGGRTSAGTATGHGRRRSAGSTCWSPGRTARARSSASRPERRRTWRGSRPSASVVLVAYQRRSVMSRSAGPRLRHRIEQRRDVVAVVRGAGLTADHDHAGRQRGSTDRRSGGLRMSPGSSVNVPVDGSQTRALSPVDQTRTLPVDSVTMCFAWTPQSRSGPHSPLSTGAAATT